MRDKKSHPTEEDYDGFILKAITKPTFGGILLKMPRFGQIKPMYLRAKVQELRSDGKMF